MAERAGRSGPKYRRIADDLRSRIRAGEFMPGQQLPTLAVLKAHYGVSVNTADRAIEVLRQERVVETSQGSGMFVLEPEPEPDDRYARLARRVDALETHVTDLRAVTGLDHAATREGETR